MSCWFCTFEIFSVAFSEVQVHLPRHRSPLLLVPGFGGSAQPRISVSAVYPVILQDAGIFRSTCSVFKQKSPLSLQWEAGPGGGKGSGRPLGCRSGSLTSYRKVDSGQLITLTAPPCHTHTAQGMGPLQTSSYQDFRNHCGRKTYNSKLL